MPIVTGKITHDGAVIDVLVGVSQNREKALKRAGFPTPQLIPVRVEIDTGSFATAFMPSVFESLSVGPIARIPVRTPSTKPGEPHLCDQFDVSVRLVSGMDTVYLPSIQVIAAADFDTDGAQAIIGRDILRRCVFFYFGPDQKFQLAF